MSINFKKLRDTYSSNRKLFFVLLWMSMAPLLFSTSFGLWVYQYEAEIRSFSLIHWIITFLIIVITMSLAMTPTTFIALVSGYFLGWNGAIPVVLTYQTASYLGYYLGKNVNRNLVDQLVEDSDYAKQMINNIHKRQFWVVIMSRISPVLPFALMNVVLSTAKIRLLPFLIGGLIGMLPRTLFFLGVGTKAQEVMDLMSRDSNYLILILTAVAVFAILYWMIKPSRRRIP